MKLYCVKILTNNIVVDVLHLVSKDNKEVHKRMDKFLEGCKEYDIEYNGYSFSEIKTVDDFTIEVIK